MKMRSSILLSKCFFAQIIVRAHNFRREIHALQCVAMDVGVLVTGFAGNVEQKKHPGRDEENPPPP